MSLSNTRIRNQFRNSSGCQSRFLIRKKEPTKLPQKKSDIYVTNKSTYKCNLERIEKLWNRGEPEIVVRALGAAIPRAINACLQFQRNHFNVLDLETTTGTVNLVDEFEPLTDEDDYETITRRNSSICIKIIRKINPSDTKSE